MNELREFIRDICILFRTFIEEDTKISRKNKKIFSFIEEARKSSKRKKDNKHQRYTKFKERMENARSATLKLNSSFLYMFTLFELYMVNLTKLNIEKDKTVKARYILKFKEFVKKKIKSEDRSEDWLGIGGSPAKMIRNYNLLEAKENQINLTRELFQIDSEDKNFSYHWKRYVEARERRNLLTHRGYVPDKRYYNALSRKNALGQTSKKFLEMEVFTSRLLQPQYKEYKNKDGGKIVYQDPKDPEDLSINRNYFRDTFKSLLFLSIYFFLHTKEIDPSNKDNPVETLHNLGMLSEDMKTNFLWDDCLNLFEVYLRKLEGDGTKAHPFSIVNYLIAAEISSRKLKSKAKKARAKSILDEKQKFLGFIPPSEGERKDLITHYLEGDIDSFIKTTKKMFKDKQHRKTMVNDWLIFQKYKGNRKFKTALGINSQN